MGASINWGTPKWMIHNGNPINVHDLEGTTVLGNLQLSMNVVANEFVASQSDLIFVRELKFLGNANLLAHQLMSNS